MRSGCATSSRSSGMSALDRCIREVNLALAALKAPSRCFGAVTTWEDSFFTLAFRWQILVLCADSASGKSTYAESLFTNPFCLTVEESEHLDLKDLIATSMTALYSTM